MLILNNCVHFLKILKWKNFKMDALKLGPSAESGKSISELKDTLTLKTLHKWFYNRLI